MEQRQMYEDSYNLTRLERDSFEDLCMTIDQLGYLPDIKNPKKPRPYGIVRGGRFLVDMDKRVWSLTLEGRPKVPGETGGTPRRNSVVEMWTGNWRRVKCDDGKFRYAKQIVNVCIDDHVGRRASLWQIPWYETQCGYKHPYDKPDNPTAKQIAELEGQRVETQQAIFARMEQEAGLDTGAIKAAVLKEDQVEPPATKPAPRKRTNQRKPAAAKAQPAKATANVA